MPPTHDKTMNNQGKTRPLFISLIPNLMGGEGHIIPYHQAVGKSAQNLGWEHLVLMPRNSPNNLFPQQKNCLFDADLEAEGMAIAKLFRIKFVIQLAASIITALRQQQDSKNRTTIIFIERFIHLQLFALTLAIWLIPVENLQVWILYRRDVHHDKTRFLYKMLNRLIKLRLAAQHLRFLTDSDPLKVALSDYFEEEIIVMPIPHTDIDVTPLQNKQDSPSPIMCWWAGSPREEKGWEIMRKLTQIPIPQGKKICVVAAKSSQLVSHAQGVQIELIDDRLSRQEYNEWFGKSDMVLIPYDSLAYRERTSGVFTEAIIAGRIPLVTPQTWMAQELEKYQLQDLILDWQNPQLVCDQIRAIANNLAIFSKITQMQKEFRDFHSSDNYTNVLASLLATRDN